MVATAINIHPSSQRTNWSVITGSGCYIPEECIPNYSFLNNNFYSEQGTLLDEQVAKTIDTLEYISGISERRYLTAGLSASNMAAEAVQSAIDNAGIDKEKIDYLIVAHNFGDVPGCGQHTSQVPSVAARVKNLLRITNPGMVSFDMLFGCPGWVQGVIQADYILRSSEASCIVVAGTETLSRVADPHDRDSMLYSDGAGAVVLQRITQEEPVGIISHAARTDAQEDACYLWMGQSNNPCNNGQYLKMKGRLLHRYALSKVPELLKQCIDKAGIGLHDISKLLLHQANSKMDEAIARQLFNLYGEQDVPENIMPMCINWLGNNSVATLPTLYTLLREERIAGHRLLPGNYIAFGSVGAGMSANGFIYKIPHS